MLVLSKQHTWIVLYALILIALIAVVAVIAFDVHTTSGQSIMAPGSDFMYAPSYDSGASLVR